jgi:putative ABC transport system permease protein
MRSNLARTSLTVLGMVIGIAMVIVVYSAGEGIRNLIVGQVEAFGTDIIETEVKVPTQKKGAEGDAQTGQAVAQGVQVTTLKLKDMEDIKKLPNVKNAYSAVQAQEQVSYGNETRRSFMLGVNAAYIDIDKSEVATGRFFSEEEDKSLAQVVVLGSKIKTKLFGDADAVGKFVKIRKSKFQVVGVMKSRGASGFMDFDDWMLLPIRTVQKKILGIDYVYYMIHQLYDVGRADETAADAKFIIRENHQITNPDKDDFRVYTMAEMMSMLDIITGAITLLLLAIVSISLVVGGVGIMNIMYVVVSERTMEIGLRKAVGARYGDIMKQFLFEAVLITLLGGVVGVVVGIGLSLLVSWIASSALGSAWEFSIPLKGFAVALGFSFFFGIVFGVYPARKAARLNPIEALISE